MNNKIDPKTFGIHPSAHIEQTGENDYVFIIDRKSRIIMKDGRRILENAGKIRSKIPDARIGVKTSTLVCSKTEAFLAENGIRIER